LIRDQLAETPEKSDRQIAGGLGIGHVTVGAQRKDLELTGQIDQLKTCLGADGKERPRRPATFFFPDAAEQPLGNAAADVGPAREETPAQTRIDIQSDRRKRTLVYWLHTGCMLSKYNAKSRYILGYY
jgi:hypothetical protein